MSMEEPPVNQPFSSGITTFYGMTRTAGLRPAWDLLQGLDLRPDERVLIAPAREGLLLNLMASFHKGGKLSGLEGNPDLLGTAMEKLSSLEESQTEVDLHNLPFTSVPFVGRHDAVLVNFHLPQVENVELAFKLILKNLRPGGRFAFQTPIQVFSPLLEEVLEDTLKADASLPDFQDLPKPPEQQDLEALLNGLSFRDLEIVQKTYIEPFPSVMAAADSLFEEGGWGGMEGLPLKKKEELACEIKLRVVHMEGSDGPIDVPFRRILVWGRR